MQTNYIAFAIPVFFILIGLEYFICRLTKQKFFRFKDSITALNCGIGQQMVGIFLEGVLIAVYVFIYKTFRVVTYGEHSLLPWVLGFLGVDLTYYWWHRSSHRVSIIWATHVVHHQSQDYNLAVALRQAWFSSVTSSVFYLPLAVIGISPFIFVILHSLSTLYQFWIHTQTISNLGPLELVLNSPAHHRVHHGINPRYLDKNYAATLIIWDRLFGTFQKEDELAVYGTVKPYESWNSVWANFEFLYYLWKECRNAELFRDKLKIWFMPPDWRPANSTPFVAPSVDSKSFVKFDTPTSFCLNLYVGINFVLITVLTTLLLFKQNTLDSLTLLGGALLVLWTVLNFGGLFEMKPWAKGSEVFRILAVLNAVIWAAARQ